MHVACDLSLLMITLYMGSLQRPLNQITIASNSLDSSVMITRVRQFRNPNRRGAAMRMNSDAVEFVSCFVY